MPEWGIALIGVAGLIVGAIITEVRHWLDRKQRFRAMTFKERLRGHQEALSLIYKLDHDICSNSLSDTDKNESIKRVISWWEDNQLLLDKASSYQMQVLFSAAANHIFDPAVRQSEFFTEWRNTRETIIRGIGVKYTHDTSNELKRIQNRN